MMGVMQVTVLSMSVTSAVAGISPGCDESEVGVADDGVGGVIGDAARESGASDGPADAVGVGDLSGIGAVGDADADVGVGGLGVSTSSAAPMVRAPLAMLWRLVALVVLRR